jgi:Flp pilus assembly protein TadG
MTETAQKDLSLCYHARMMHRTRREQRGQVVPLFALLLVVLIPVIGLTLNVGVLTNEQGYTQRGTDATALAAAMIITEGQSEMNATATAQEVAAANNLNSNTLQIEYLDSNGNQTDIANDVAYVQVSDQEQRTALLGGFIGVGWDTVTTKSRAAIGSANPVCGICILSSGANHALSVTGNSSISVQAGSIRVNSNSSSALYLNGNAVVNAPDIELTGNYSSTGGVTFSTSPQTGVPPIRNPLAGLPAPSISGPTYTASGPSSGQTTMQPGIYTAAYTVNQTISMAPGIYVFEDGLNVGSSAVLTGNGVTLYFTCSGYSQTDTQPCNSGSVMNSLTTSGSGSYNLTAPSSGNYQGVVLMQDPGNTASINMGGNSTDTVNGTIYAPSATLNVSGTASDGATTYNSIIVANSMSVSGNGTLNLDATPQSNAPATYDGGLPYLV